MKKSGRGREPYIRPVTRIELPEINVKLRWIAIVVLLSVAAVAIGKGLYAAVNVQPGWQTVEAASKEPNCGRDFVFQYDLGDAGSGAAAQLRKLNELYTQAAQDGYRIFSAEAEGAGNVRYLNEHVNEAVALDPALYRALEVFDEKTMPYLFLAPAAEEYNRVFLCEDDGEAALYDPTRDGETARWLEGLTAYANDSAHISLVLLGENQARLNVSQDYLDFAAENDIGIFLDFGWMKNAFIADFLAETLRENGFTSGYLASYDGFTRNLDDRGEDYAVNLFDRKDADLYAPARLHYNGPMSLVFLRDYPATEQDRWHYYAYETGEILTAYLDPADAMSKTSIPTLLGYADDRGCAGVLMELLPVFVADEFRPQSLGERVDAVWFENDTLYHTDADAALELLPNSGGLDYHIQ